MNPPIIWCRTVNLTLLPFNLIVIYKAFGYSHLVLFGQAEPYLPYEYTHEGMLQRLNAYIKHQDFCSPHPEIWPPLSSINVTVSSVGKSCKTTCWEGSE